MPLLEGEWRLEYPGVSVGLGGYNPATNPFRLPAPIHHRTAPVVGDANLVTEDTQQPRRDGDKFGSDFRGGRPITFDLGIQGSTEYEARELAGTVQEAWDADGIRFTPGSYATLTTRNAGRERAVYGRPRRFTADYSAVKSSGLVTAQCDFQTIDGVFYGGQDVGIRLSFNSAPSTGIKTPIITPITTTPITSRPGAIEVEGRKPVWPVITVYGPILNPTVSVSGSWRLQLLTNIPQGQSITMDTRPWRRSVTRFDGASFAGTLARGSRLDRASLAPGRYVLDLSGVDYTGVSMMQFSWRTAWASL